MSTNHLARQIKRFESAVEEYTMSGAQEPDVRELIEKEYQQAKLVLDNAARRLINLTANEKVLVLGLLYEDAQMGNRAAEALYRKLNR